MQRNYSVVENKFEVGGGMWVNYRDHRPAQGSSGVPIVFLPGLMRNAVDFDRMAHRFAGQRRVVTIDTRGRGKAGRSDDPAAYRFDPMIEDVWRLLDHLEVGRMVLIGVALGAFMSYRMAAEQPARIAGIVTCDTGTELVNKAGKSMVALADQAEYELADAIAKIKGGYAKSFLDFGPDDWDEYTRQIYVEVRPGKWKRNFHPAVLDAWATTKEELPSLWDTYAGLGELPVAILRGEHSPFLTQEWADRMAAALPRARTVSVQGRGHPLRMDEPASLAAMRQILAEADAAA